MFSEVFEAVQNADLSGFLKNWTMHCSLYFFETVLGEFSDGLIFSATNLSGHYFVEFSKTVLYTGLIREVF